MKGEAEKIVRFFDGAKNRFKIPLYQRNYDWTKENCQQLFSDLKKLMTGAVQVISLVAL